MCGLMHAVQMTWWEPRRLALSMCWLQREYIEASIGSFEGVELEMLAPALVGGEGKSRACLSVAICDVHLDHTDETFPIVSRENTRAIMMMSATMM